MRCKARGLDSTVYLLCRGRLEVVSLDGGGGEGCWEGRMMVKINRMR
jgi:hypothetical protein